MTTPNADENALQAAPSESQEPKAATKATAAPQKPRVAPRKAKAEKKGYPGEEGRQGAQKCEGRRSSVARKPAN